MRSGLFLILLLFSMLVTACSHSRVYDFKPGSEPNRPIVFGFLYIQVNGKPANTGAVVTFESGEVLELDRAGFVAAHVTPGRSYIRKFNLPNSETDYYLPNLTLKSGPAGSRTYFGNITIRIQTGKEESWTWSVENKWAQAIGVWKKVFGLGNSKYFTGLAERTGPDWSQTRKLATDRQQVDHGL